MDLGLGCQVWILVLDVGLGFGFFSCFLMVVLHVAVWDLCLAFGFLHFSFSQLGLQRFSSLHCYGFSVR